jgi:hypothetical protein
MRLTVDFYTLRLAPGDRVGGIHAANRVLQLVVGEVDDRFFLEFEPTPLTIFLALVHWNLGLG